MKIWLINPYGPIPGEGWRDYRCTMLGEVLAEHGHEVIWWTANFSHHFKKFRSSGWHSISVTDNFKIYLVPTSRYFKNISLQRILFEIIYSRNLYKQSLLESPPDLIVAQSPSMTYIFNRLARKLASNLVIDMFDLWPELFTLALPRFFRPVATFLMLPLYIQRRNSLRQAHGLIGVCDSYLQIALDEMSPFIPKFYETIFIGVDVQAIRKTHLPKEQAEEFARSLGKTSNDIWAIYAGSLGDNYDIATLLAACALLKQTGLRIKVIIAGDGPLRQYVIDSIQTRHLDNIVFVGKLRPDELVHYYQVCDMGLCTYNNLSTVAMPTKVYDYLAAGLPIVNSLLGDVAALLCDRQIGIQYQAGNPKSLADALESLAADEERRLMMARNSNDAAMQFDKHVQYQKFVDLVESLPVAEKANQR